ncbi:MAG: hypothetical protein ACOYOB_11740 [Myxococcota bacterium]
MIPDPESNETWLALWAVIRSGAELGRGPAGLDLPDGLEVPDFLDFSTPDRSESRAFSALSAAGPDRSAQVCAALALVGEAAPQLASALGALQSEPLLDALDADGAWLLCRCLTELQQPFALPLESRLGRLLARALASSEVLLADAAVDAVRTLGAGALQGALLQRLAHDVDLHEHARIERWLGCLEAIADDDAVRGLEEWLYRQGPRLSAPHAWRARRLIQQVRQTRRR